MGSRLRENVKQLFECFCEVAAPVGENPAWILQKYPANFSDDEILKSVPKFAYPCEVENLLVQHFSFVLTSIDSKWTFGFCRHDPKTDTALVVLSVLPWHETFYKLLNHIASLTSNTSGKDLWTFLGNVFTSEIPIPGNSITIPSPDPSITFVCQSPKQFQLPSIPENRNLTEYFSAVDAHNMMIIFASMLYERRIIFTSKRLSRLSACVQACNALIYPMIWQHIYIPVLPRSLIDYLLAPMPFLIGVPAPTLQRVCKNDLGDVVILDADNNAIETPFQDLDSLPLDVVTNLKKALRNRPALLGDGVSRAFLRALVQLTAGYREALTLHQGERITFDQNAFVESRPSSMQPFLRKMLELQIFQQFIEERLNMLNSGLGFSDEFEMEACSYSVKSSNKFMQQYKEWTYTMKRESSAFFRSVKDKANPAVKYAVKSVRDKGKDMKTAYKGLKWKGRARNDTGIRFHQPRSAPSSPSMDRKSNEFTSPPKSPNGFTAKTSYRKELHLRNSNFTDPSRKQYSPLSPSSPEESESQPQRLNIDLMQELRDVIFPNLPPVDRTLKPVRSLDSLRSAWSGRSRHGPLPNTAPVHLYNKTHKTLSSPSTSYSNSSTESYLLNTLFDDKGLTVNQFSPFTCNINQTRASVDNQLLNLDEPNSSMEHKKFNDLVNSTHQFKAIDSCNIIKATISNPSSNDISKDILDSNIEVIYSMCNLHLDDPFDTSKVFQPCYLQKPMLQSTNLPLNVKARTPMHPLNATFCSAQLKESPEVPDLIRLDSANSDDFDPLLSKSSDFSASSKQMSQSLHIPEIREGLSNPLYPYFEPTQNDHRNTNKSSDSLGDLDLLQAYGLDFNKFGMSNGESSSRNHNIVQQTSESSINKIDNAFRLPMRTSTVKPQNNWTKFD